MKSILNRASAKCLPLCLFVLLSNSAFGQPEVAVEKYLRAVKTENWAEAQSFWLNSEIERSRRMGILYDNIYAKYDCSSPLINSPQYILDVTVNPAVEFISDDKARVQVSVLSFRDSTTIPYYLKKENGSWRLCSPMAIYTSGWDSIQTRYVKLFYSDKSRINRFALNRLDAFIDSLSMILDIAPERMRHLQEVKLDYYLCSQEEIELVTGFKAQGMTNFQFDAVITQHLPHTHELVHFMINYTLRELPLYTLPVIQEGLACCLGGRWGKAPEVIFYWGSASQSLGFGDLEEIMDFSGFHHGQATSDISYALSALVVKTMIDDFGIAKFKDYYRAVSGTGYEVASLPAEIAKLKAEEVFGTTWDEFKADYLKLADSYKYYGILPVGSIEGRLIKQLKSGGTCAGIFEGDRFYYFKIVLAYEKTRGDILLSEKGEPIEEEYRSKFYHDHLPGEKYEGERYGIQFSRDETGLYDFYTNCLLTKYIPGFSPDDNYWDGEKREIMFKLDKTLLDEPLRFFEIKLTCNNSAGM
jgi:hypothetical protein